MAVQTYCTSSDVDDVLAQHTSSSFLDDEETGVTDPTSYTPQIERAATRINMYVCVRYALADVVANDWLKYANAVIAAYNVVQRRLNSAPSGLRKDYEEVLDDLKSVKNGVLPLPEQNESFASSRPMVSNMQVVRGSYDHPIRVRQEQSSVPSSVPKIIRHPT